MANVHVVLLVEDEPDIREALHSALHQETCEVLLAVDGAEALKTLAQRRERAEEMPCVILMDLWMAGMSGDELLGELARDTELAKIAVVVLTGVPDLDIAERWPQVSRVIRKPFRLEAVVDAIQPTCESCTDAPIRL